MAQSNQNSRRMVFCAYPYELDRHGTTIRPSAFILENYLKNPIVSFAHDNMDELPVGKATKVWTVLTFNNPDGLRPGLWCEIEFARHPFAEDLYQCYLGGFMNAVSVEADAIDYELPGKDFPGQTGPTYTQVELIDISCVPVPGNADALAQRARAAASTGQSSEAILRALGRVHKAAQGHKINVIKKAKASPRSKDNYLDNWIKRLNQPQNPIDQTLKKYGFIK